MAVLLILLTWLVWAGATMGFGVQVIRLHSHGSRLPVRSQAQLGLWVGLFGLVLATIALNFFVPMFGGVARWLAFAWILIGAALLIRWAFANGRTIKNVLGRLFWPLGVMNVLLGMLLLGSFLIAAWFAAAEPMDYDAGLYRMGIINYAAEYPAISGLANLHGRFGFNSALGPLASFLSNGIWEDNGFRLVTGFVLTIFLLTVAFRVLVANKSSAGDFFLIMGWAFIAWVVLDDSGRWLPSPSQDLMALITGLMAFVYFIDFVNVKTRQKWMASAAIMIAAISASFRPLSWLLVVCLVLGVYLAPVLLKPRSSTPFLSHVYLIPSLISTFVLGIVLMARDAIISGWLLFPLTRFPLPVDWRTVSPEGESLGITWWGRAPFMSIEQAQSQGWFGPWLDSFLFGREMRFFLLSIAAALIPIIWSAGRRAWGATWASILVSLAPALIVSVVWFVTAPDIRFGWAGLFALSAIPISFLLAQDAYPTWMYRSVFVVLVALGLATNWRVGHFEQRGNAPEPYSLNIAGHDIVLNLGPPNKVSTVPGSLGDGTQIRYPENGENCYMVFPLCLLPGSGENIEKRGLGIREGFRVIP